MIEAKSVVKTFGGFTALDGASITVPDGGVYGLVGPNGAGKSTLIRHLTGICRPDSGEVLVEGEPVYENPEKKVLVAAIPDDWYYFPSASVADMARFYQGFYPSFDRGRYEKFRAVFTLPENTPIRRMSKGMQKQAAFWLTMSCRPKYLILDEPVDVCDHVGMMNRGKVLVERSLADLQENIVKLQAVWRAGELPVLPRELEVLHTSHVGRVYTYIVRGTAAAVTERMEQYQPLMLEALPLSLEEIFIYELGGEHYAVKEILL